MIHMAQRMLLPTSTVLLGGQENEAARRLALNDLHILKRGPVITIEAISEYYAMTDQESWGFEDFPNCAPPFRSCVLQWTTPNRIKRKGRDELINVQSQQAVVMYSFDREDEFGRETLEKLSAKQFPDTEGSELTAKQAIDQCRWVVSFSMWIAPFDRQCVGKAHCLGVKALVMVDRAGRGIYGCLSGPLLHRLAALPDGVNGAWCTIHVALLAISFMHCKNITIKDDRDSLPSAKWHRRQRVPVVTNKVLNIAPMREVLRREGGSDEVGGKRALHICRGHFSTYNDEAPLFGKITGTFWVPQHVRGTKEAGEVVKDYEIRD